MASATTSISTLWWNHFPKDIVRKREEVSNKDAFWVRSLLQWDSRAERVLSRVETLQPPVKDRVITHSSVQITSQWGRETKRTLAKTETGKLAKSTKTEGKILGGVQNYTVPTMHFILTSKEQYFINFSCRVLSMWVNILATHSFLVIVSIQCRGICF